MNLLKLNRIDAPSAAYIPSAVMADIIIRAVLTGLEFAGRDGDKRAATLSALGLVDRRWCLETIPAADVSGRIGRPTFTRWTRPGALARLARRCTPCVSLTGPTGKPMEFWHTFRRSFPDVNVRIIERAA